MKLLDYTDQRKKASERLGLTPDADRQTVRRAFHQLAFGCHPDLFGGDLKMAHRFNLLSEAYRVMMENIDTGIEQNRTPKSSAAPSRRGDLQFRLFLDTHPQAAPPTVRSALQVPPASSTNGFAHPAIRLAPQ